MSSSPGSRVTRGDASKQWSHDTMTHHHTTLLHPAGALLVIVIWSVASGHHLQHNLITGNKKFLHNIFTRHGGFWPGRTDWEVFILLLVSSVSIVGWQIIHNNTSKCTPTNPSWTAPVRSVMSMFMMFWCSDPSWRDGHHHLISYSPSLP